MAWVFLKQTYEGIMHLVAVAGFAGVFYVDYILMVSMYVSDFMVNWI